MSRGPVARGAALLDEQVPGWENLIDVDRLDMGHCEDCVLGQIAKRKGWDEGANPYESARDRLGLPAIRRYGFEFDVAWTYRRLGRAWKAAIRRRRAKAAA